jgi:hypothetical protein
MSFRTLTNIHTCHIVNLPRGYDETTMATRTHVRLNEMRSLFDLGQLPLAVCAGAVVNVLFTIVMTRIIRHGALAIALPVWIAIVLAANLLPVVLLRVVTLKPQTTFRPVHQMSFLADQHKFPLWVYLLASANMTLWICIAWVVFGKPDDPKLHLVLMVSAIVFTSFPAWIRLLRD